jgi:hypothetical protein
MTVRLRSIERGSLTRDDPNDFVAWHSGESPAFRQLIIPLFLGIDDDLGWDRQRPKVPANRTTLERLRGFSQNGYEVKVASHAGVAAGVRTEVAEA